MNKDNAINQLQELNSIKSSNMLMKKSLLDLLPTKGKDKEKQWLKLIFLTVFSLAIVYNISYSTDEIATIKSIVSIINNIDLVLLGIVFTGFSLFQAIVNKNVLKSFFMFDSGSEEHSDSNHSTSNSFVQLNQSYYFLMSNYVFNIFINVPLLLLLSSISKTYMKLLLLNFEFIINILLFFYLLLSSLIIYELKYFLFNLFSVFTLKTTLEVCEILKDEEDKN